jgi:threonine/homoserine/homoserine lactone efflux protein
VDLQFAAFLGIAVLVIVTPGPDTALTVRNTLRGGRGGGLGTALGVATGQAVWTAATSAGVAALLVASTPAFQTLRLAGAAYLVWLGAQALWAAARPGGDAVPAGDLGRSRRLTPPAAFRQGVVSNLANPKMAVFFTSLLPQFAPAGHASFSALLALGLLFCAMTLVWLAAYAAVVARMGDTLRRLGARRAIEAVTGLALLALGARLAFERR